jgi:predicted ATPase
VEQRAVFVGRDTEMALLRAGVDDATRGQGRFFLLTGEPGIGKTRTAEELASYAVGHAVHPVWGRCYEAEGAPPFWPWVQILRVAVNRSGDRVGELLGDRAPYIAQLVPELAWVVSGLAPALTADPDDARARLFESISAFLRNLADEQPLMLVIDDLQGADQGSLTLLQFLVQSISDGGRAPLLIVASCRAAAVAQGSRLDDALGALAGGDGRAWIRLRGLRTEEVGRFIGTHAGEELAPRVRATPSSPPRQTSWRSRRSLRMSVSRGLNARNAR